MICKPNQVSRERLRDASRSLPERPGVYLMRDSHGSIIYVGKAVNLRRRVMSYTTLSAMRDRKVEKLVSQFDSLSFIPTHSEIEALLVESRLIKANLPIFNRRLTEPDSCCYFVLEQAEYPVIRLTAVHESEDAPCIGPIWRSGMAREAGEAVTELFQLRRCMGGKSRRQTKSCIYYEFRKCCGPCMGVISPVDYAARVEMAWQVLSGDVGSAIEQLLDRRNALAEECRYERALTVHRQIEALEYIGRTPNFNVIVGKKFGIAAPSYLRKRPVVLIFGNGRLRWRALAGPRSYPDREMIAAKVAGLDARCLDILPGKPTGDDYLIIRSYMQHHGCAQHIHTLEEISCVDGLIESIDALRRYDAVKRRSQAR